MSDLRIGSLCTGYGGLDQAVNAVFGGTTAWVSDIDPGASQIIKHRMPGTPNIGDLTTTHWAAVEPVDIVLGGYPCQPFSTAGKRKGTADERHIWPDIARALGVLRPRIAIFENVGGHLRLGFDVVLADLAALGFDVEWCVVRASEVGAPHQRRRLFIYATATDAPNVGHERAGCSRGRRPGPADHRDVAAHADGHALRQQPDGQPRRGSSAVPELPGADAASDAPSPGFPGQGVRGRAPERGAVAADPARLGRGEGRPEPAWLEGRPGATGGGGAAPTDADRRRLARNPERDSRPQDGQPEREPRLDPHGHDLLGPVDWGRFAPAIGRWEAATGRSAPRATDARNRLSPRFVEWLMGLEAGWVTDVPGLSRTQRLHALGNGVVPQQAEAAIRLLAARAASHTAAAA